MNWYKLLVPIVVLLMQSCSGQVSKINGVSYVAARDTISEVHVNPVVNVNANYAAIMPFGFIRDLTHPEIIYNTERQWFGETREGVKQYVEELNKKNIKIMLKPQIWVWRGEYTGFIAMETEDNWKILETSYSNFILEYASLAQELQVPLFCIGTELEQFIANRPQYWKSLISQIKEIYDGKLTYAANWDEFKRTPFWDQLDYIGVDAYFPVSDEKTPTVEDCLAGWQNHKTTIKSVHESYNKPVLFTEFGYRSVDHTGREPWISDRNITGVNMQAQVNATTALFQSFWDEEWFAGGFIWKWFIHHKRVGGEDNHMFTPQNKPVEAVIKSYYSNNE